MIIVIYDKQHGSSGFVQNIIFGVYCFNLTTGYTKECGNVLYIIILSVLVTWDTVFFLVYNCIQYLLSLFIDVRTFFVR